jgi:hypothetical protein
MPDLFKAEDAIGTVHYSRFTVLSDKTFLFLADFDGEFGQFMLDLAGAVFDTIFTIQSGMRNSCANIPPRNNSAAQ